MSAATPSGLSVDVRSRIGAFELRARFVCDAGLTVVFGPSGAGKTRLLRTIAGLDRPDAGRITLDGTVFVDRTAGIEQPVHERRIGMVFQQPYLLPHRTVLANVGLAVRSGEPARTARDRARTARGWLERVGAEGLATRRPGQLSGGEQQRVALARALAGEPRLLLLDEPFSALDLPVRLRLRTLVADLVASSGLPALFVTHDAAELSALADRVLLAEGGRITRTVTVEEAVRGLPPGS